MLAKQMLLSRGVSGVAVRWLHLTAARPNQEIAAQATPSDALPPRCEKKNAIKLLKRIDPEFNETKFREKVRPLIEQTSKALSERDFKELQQFVAGYEIERISRPLSVLKPHELDWLRIEGRDIVYDVIADDYRHDECNKDIHMRISVYGLHHRHIQHMSFIKKFYSAHFRFRKSYDTVEALPTIARINYNRGFTTSIL